MTKQKFTVRIRSVFAIGSTRHVRSRGGSDKELILELEPETRIEDLLKKLPSLGPPESFDDIMIHVFVNGRLRGHDHVLEPGDVVDLHLPVSGG